MDALEVLAQVFELIEEVEHSFHPAVAKGTRVKIYTDGEETKATFDVETEGFWARVFATPQKNGEAKVSMVQIETKVFQGGLKIDPEGSNQKIIEGIAREYFRAKAWNYEAAN